MLDDTAIDEPGKKKIDFFDSIITGLGLEVRASGGKTFWLRYSRGPKEQKAIKIAVYGDLSVDKVRKEAQRLRSQVVLGNDPAAEKAEKRAVIRYAALADQHLDYARSYQKSSANVERIMRLHLKPRWGKLRLDEITQPAVAKWLAEKAEEGLVYTYPRERDAKVDGMPAAAKKEEEAKKAEEEEEAKKAAEDAEKGEKAAEEGKKA